MRALLNKKVSLYKELQVAQESPAGTRMIYTCYEAIPNGGFCIISAIPEGDTRIQLKRATYTKAPSSISSGIEIEFFPTLIEAINAYSAAQTSSAS